MRAVARFLGLVAFTYIAIASYMYWYQEDLIFHPVPVEEGYDYAFSTPTEDIWLPHEKGRLHGVLFKNISDARGVVLYFKGNFGNISFSERQAHVFMRLGYDVIAMDYRGSGKSIGPLSEKVLLQDAERWYDWASDRYGDNHVRVVGYSLGTTFASHVAAVKQVAHTILLAPMKSIEDIAAHRYPLLPSFLTRYPLRSYEKLKQAVGQVIIYHGTNDRVVPYASGAALGEVLDHNDRFLTITGGTHYDLLTRGEVLADIRSRW
ncbi:alpha/beta hydrolase [Kordiimonas laminariae]|uniref:alpha/beta hydrolase n=1 Tax=Kordiimonas laminariae TaxID=2917717 RepID=UPI001FF52CFA|nr:alpha/beta hydrolase [Kordiimonas laminariae]